MTTLRRGSASCDDDFEAGERELRDTGAVETMLEARVDIGAVGLKLRLACVELGLAGGRLALAGDELGLGLSNLRFHLLAGGVDLGLCARELAGGGVERLVGRAAALVDRREGIVLPIARALRLATLPMPRRSRSPTSCQPARPL